MTTVLTVCNSDALKQGLRESAPQDWSVLERENSPPSVDAILLDRSDMKAEGGFEPGPEILSLIREYRKPVLAVLPDSADATMRLAIMLAGATDVVSAPVTSEELILRLKRLVREGKHNLLAGVQLNERDWELEFLGRKISLTKTEFCVLRVLVQNLQKTLHRNELLNAAWGEVRVGSRSIDAHVVTLRKKLEGSGLQIISKYGQGYRLDFETDF